MGFIRSLLGLNNAPDAAAPAAENDGTVPDVGGDVRPLFAFIRGMLGNLATERIEQLTLREAIRRFVEERPDRPCPVRGALIVQPHREGKLVAWAFLDPDDGVVLDDNGAPLGRKAICSRLDDELNDMLAGRELLIVE